jgi:hypothetical protein
MQYLKIVRALVVALSCVALASCAEEKKDVPSIQGTINKAQAAADAASQAAQQTDQTSAAIDGAEDGNEDDGEE